MRWLWRRRWGYTVILAGPAGVVERTVWATRYWTRAGAQRAADGHLAMLDEYPGLRELMTFKVSELPPLVDIPADRFWRGNEYVGPEV
jgi:hypothetical protein